MKNTRNVRRSYCVPGVGVVVVVPPVGFPKFWNNPPKFESVPDISYVLYGYLLPLRELCPFDQRKMQEGVLN